MTRVVPAGWYPDPWLPGQRRWWTGERWTGDVFADATAGEAGGAAAAAGSPPPPDRLNVSPPAPAWRAAEPPQPFVAPVLDAPAAPASSGRRRLPLAWMTLALGLVLGFLASSALSAVRSEDEDSEPRAAASAAPSIPAPRTPTPLPSPGEPAPAPSRPTPPGSGERGPFQLEPFREPEFEPGTPSPEGSPRPPDADARALDELGLRQADVPAGTTVSLIRGGDLVAGERTLDLCDAAYPSESRRTARKQVAAFDGDASSVLSTEAVLYDAPAALTAAFAELRAAAPACATPAVDKDWPQTAGVERLAFDAESGFLGGRSTAVYLRRGRVLLALYFGRTGNTTVPIAGRTAVPEIVEVFARRLNELPAAVVGG